MKEYIIRPCAMEHVKRYGEIYAAAFSGEPWFDNWKAENAEIHVREILESEQSYGLEYVKDDEICGFILGSSMLFSYGRTFEINDLAVAIDDVVVLNNIFTAVKVVAFDAFLRCFKRF